MLHQHLTHVVSRVVPLDVVYVELPGVVAVMADLGHDTVEQQSAMEEYWRNIGGILEEYSRNTGGILEEYWTNTGNILEEYWVNTGGILEEYWRNAGGILEEY